MKKRSIGIMILGFLFTLGIYPLYWWCSFQNQIKLKTGLGFGGGMHLLMSLITFGIYPIYWYCVVGGRIEKAGGKNNTVLYVVLLLTMVASWLTPFLMQSDVNQING